MIFIIMFLAACLRLYHLDTVPPGLDWDETSIGWNAYTISQTGRDEYGVRLPVSIRSFNDYKPSLYTYLAVPSVAVFGRTEAAVRFPSVLAGLLAIVGVYLLMGRKKLGLLSALAMTITPWHIQFSRVAFEANLALTAFIFGVYFLKSQRLGRAVFAFVLSLYAYHSPRLVVPIFSMLCWRVWFKNLRSVLVVGLLAAILLFPLVRSSVRTGSLAARFDKVKIADTGQVVHNYFQHFSLDFLFLNVDNTDRHHAPTIGLLLWWELPFILVGAFKILKKRPSWVWLVLAWLAAAPIASAITKDSPHAVRALLLLPPLTILAAFGLHKKLAKIIAIVVVGSFLFYSYQYFVRMPVVYASSWQFGYKELVNYLKPIDKDIYVTLAYDQPYVYFLYYGDGKIIQNNGELWQGWGKYHFINFSQQQTFKPSDLLVIAPDEFVKGFVKESAIKYPDGTDAFLIGHI